MRYLGIGVLSLAMVGCAEQPEEVNVLAKGEKLRQLQIQCTEIPSHVIKGNQNCVKSVQFKGVKESETYASKPGQIYPRRYLYDVVHTSPCNSRIEFWWHSPATESSQRKDSFMEADLSQD